MIKRKYFVERSAGLYVIDKNAEKTSKNLIECSHNKDIKKISCAKTKQWLH